MPTGAFCNKLADSALRQKLWKVGAVAQTSVQQIWFHFSAR
jgi:hypothetical protein